MQKPERLIGFVTIDNTDFPFEFDEKNFTLNLYPPSTDIQEKKRVGIFDVVNKNDRNIYKWIPSKRISGISLGGEKVEKRGLFFGGYHYILFDVEDMESNYNGFISYSVNWYFLYSDKIQIRGISGFKLSGTTIDYFYNPEVALQRNVEFLKGQVLTAKFSVSSTDTRCTGDCGEYCITDDIVAKMNVNAYSTIHYGTASNPIDAVSIFTTIFSRPIKYDEIDILLGAYSHSRLFFHYLSYRRNIGLYDVDVFFLDEDNKQNYDGLLVFKNQEQEENKENAIKRFIDYSIIGIHSAKLFSLIANKTFSYEHICDSISDTKVYPHSRIFMIMAEFEREFLNIYGKDYTRSQEYKDIKQDILNAIDKIILSEVGKRRSSAKEFHKLVQNHSNSFQSKIINALNDCKLIMEPFICKKYEKEFKKVADEIGERMGELRNGLAHSKLSFQLEAVHLHDIKIIEELIYAMRLKTIINDYKIIQKGIANLFDENMTI